jgi:hypothetical protein
MFKLFVIRPWSSRLWHRILWLVGNNISEEMADPSSGYSEGTQEEHKNTA